MRSVEVLRIITLYHHLEDMGSFLLLTYSFRIKRAVEKSCSCRSTSKSDKVPLYSVCILESALSEITTLIVAISENLCKFYGKI